MMKILIQKTFDNGRSMVEMIGVLTIVGFLTLGGIWGFDRASQMMRINDLKDQVSTLVANVRAMHMTHNDYQDLSPHTLIGAGLVPEKIIGADGDSITHILQGKVLIGPADTPEYKNTAFVIIYNGLDSFTCREITSVSWGSDISSGFLGMTIKKDGDLTVETSNLKQAEIKTGNGTFVADDLPQALISETYDSCDCGVNRICSVAWKFL